MKSWFKNNWLILVTGLVIGIAALVLGAHGNPGNMGFCIACFLRDTAGALGLHGAEVVQYFRPEIVGILLGSLIAAAAYPFVYLAFFWGSWAVVLMALAVAILAVYMHRANIERLVHHTESKFSIHKNKP